MKLIEILTFPHFSHVTLLGVLKNFLVAILVLYAASLSGQSVSATPADQTLDVVLRTLSTQHSVTFAYDSELLKKFRVTKSFTSEPLEQILSQLFEGTGLSCVKSGEVYMVIPGKPAPAPIVDVPKKMCSISGTVKDRITGEQLPFVTVFITGTAVATSTNNTGYFNLMASRCDSADISVSYIGYKPMRVRLLAQQHAKPVTIYVDNDMVDLPEIVVKTNTDLVDNNVLSGSSLIKINTSKMDVVPSLSHNDFTAPLLMLPGIDGSTETSSGFLIRKSSSDKNLVLYDGFNLYQIDHFFGSFSSLNTKAVKDLQVYKGGYDARYGGRTGGMIEITGKSGNMNKPVADVGVDMLCVDASVELPIIKEKLSLIVTGRRSYTDKFQTPLYLKLFENVSYDMEQYYRYTPQAFSSNKSSPLYAYSDLHSKITYKAKENQVFSASFFLGNDKLSFDQLYQYPSISEDGSWTTRGASIRYTGNVSSTWQQDVVLGSSLVDNYFEHYDTTLVVYNRPRLSFVDKRSKYVVMKNKLIDNSLNYFSVFQLHPSHSVQAGLGVSHIQSAFMSSNGVNSIFINKNDTSTDYHLQSSTVSPNFNYTFKNERLMIKPGLRVDVYNVTRKIYPELRLETSYKVTDNFTLKASAGNYHQYVYKVTAGNQMDFQNIWVVADGDKFPVVSSVATSLGCNYSINPTMSVDVEFYHRQTSDMTRSFEYYKVGNAGRVTTARRLLTYSNIVDGVDVLVRKSFGAYQVWLAYTLSKSRVKTKKTNNNQVLDALDDQLHECKLFNTIDWKRLRFSASFIVGSGKVWHEVVYAQTNKAAAKTTINVNPLPVYYRTDASITYNRQLGMARLSAGVSVFNVFNNKNVVSVAQKLKNDLASSAALRTAVMQTSDVYGMGCIPNVFVNIKF